MNSPERRLLASRILVLAAFLPTFSLGSRAQSARVALTFDDLPAVGTEDPTDAQSYNRAVLASLAKHHAPATGFVVEDRVVKLKGREILDQWVRQGLDLGNHTFSHADLNTLTPEQFEQEVIQGESSFNAALATAGKTPRYLRFPFNHTGDTAAKHDAVAEFLIRRGYQVGACTIDNQDYLFDSAYLKMGVRNDHLSAAKLRAEYLAYTATEIDYYSHLHEQVFGRAVAHVMLLHLNRLNAELIEQLLEIFEQKRYTFVSLEAAQSDSAYNTPDTFVSSYGPMWGYRWAQERKVAVNGNLESEPPAWISQYPAGEK
jgi:peptidoglycan/xylan/chitin deacetylase (PgdA/CDA1 family)